MIYICDLNESVMVDRGMCIAYLYAFSRQLFGLTWGRSMLDYEGAPEVIPSAIQGLGEYWGHPSA